MTRWLDIFSIFGHLEEQKIALIIIKILPKRFTILQKRWNFAKSGHTDRLKRIWRLVVLTNRYLVECPSWTVLLLKVFLKYNCLTLRVGTSLHLLLLKSSINRSWTFYSIENASHKSHPSLLKKCWFMSSFKGTVRMSHSEQHMFNIQGKHHSTAGLQFNKTGTDQWRKYNFICI